VLDRQTLHEQLVDAMTALCGEHPGYRPNHAKGIVCEGIFRPTPSAASLTRAAHMQGTAVPVMVRFSDSTGIPTIPDGDPNASPRGMAIRFHLHDGTTTDLVAHSYDGFPVRTAEEFLDYLRAVGARAADSSNQTLLDTFLAGHPHAQAFLVAPKPIPRSFATTPYYAVNAFRFINRSGTCRFGRYRILPVAREAYLEPSEAAQLPAGFLFDEIRSRLARNPIAFRLTVQLAADGDPIDDSTARWPEDRPRMEVGTLTVTKRAIDSDAVQRALAFDPARLIDGVEPSGDPLIPVRSAVYAVSAQRRSE
jgi:catalase